MLLILLLGCVVAPSGGGQVPPPPPAMVAEAAEVPRKEPWLEGCRRPPPEGMGFLIEEAANQAGIPPAWLAITVWRESGCDPSVRGSSGEIGLAQIQPRVWAGWLGTSRDGWELWLPENNLRHGAEILRHLRDSSSSTREMFRRYNGTGPSAERYADAQMRVLRGL